MLMSQRGTKGKGRVLNVAQKHRLLISLSINVNNSDDVNDLS